MNYILLILLLPRLAFTSVFDVQSNSRKAPKVEFEIIHHINSELISGINIIKFNRSKSKVLDTRFISIQECQTGNIILFERMYINILSLNCSEIDPKLGGEIGLRYLYNFKRNKYLTKYFNLQRSDLSQSWILSDGKRTSTTIKVYSNTEGGKEVGIKRIILK